jgi:two-component system phosphate regulon sensor histidine kinase PhoR
MTEPHEVNSPSITIATLQSELERLRAQLANEGQRLQRAEDDLRRALSESHALYLTSLDITGQLDLTELLRGILRRAVNMLDATAGMIFLVDQDTGEMVIHAEHAMQPSCLGARFRPGDTGAGEVLISGMPVIINDYPARMKPHDRLKAYQITALAAVPLRWGVNIIGVLSLHYTRPGSTFLLDDVDSLQRVTVQAAIAIHSAQIKQGERERNRQLQTIYEASARISESLDPTLLMRGISEAMTSAVNVTRCTVLEYFSAEGMLVQGDYDAADETNIAMSHARDTLGNLKPVREMIQQNQWMVFQRNDPMLLSEVSNYMQRWDVRSVLVVPMMVGQRSVGMIVLGDGRQTRRFTHSEIGTAQTLAAQSGVALRHAQLHAQLQSQRINEQSVLLAFTRRLLEINDVQQVADQVVSAVATAFDVRFCDLLIPENDVLKPYASVGWDRFTTIKRAISHASVVTAVQYAIMMREIVIIDDSLTETRFVVPAMITNEGLRSALIAPINFRDELIGLLIVARSEVRGFSKDDSRLASLLASQAGVALERARLWEAAQHYAQQLEAKVEDRTQEIKTEQERMNAVLANTDEELLVLDLRGRIQQVNRAFEMQHSRLAHSLSGTFAADVLGFDPVLLANKGNDNSGWRGELTIRRADGSTYNAAASFSWVNNTSGQNVGIIVSLRDLAYRSEVDKLKAQFVSNVSHELRTPLANIKLYLHLLNNGTENRRAQYMGTLEREANRLQALIEQLLLISKLERDDLPMKLRVVDANYLVSKLIEDRMNLVRQHNLTLEANLQPGEIIIYVDEFMVIQAITNLLNNAVNYTRPGGRIIIETVTEAEIDPPVVAISVVDTGMGLTEEDRDRLFERFFRGGAARQSGAAGTGLGMSIVKEIVERHHGSISIESEVGRGSRFTLRFPLHLTVSASRV